MSGDLDKSRVTIRSRGDQRLHHPALAAFLNRLPSARLADHAVEITAFFTERGWTPPPEPKKRWSCNDRHEIFDGDMLHFTAVGPYEAETLVDILNEVRP